MSSQGVAEPHPNILQFFRFHQMFREGHSPQEIQQRMQANTERKAEEVMQTLQAQQTEVEGIVDKWEGEASALFITDAERDKLKTLQSAMREIKQHQETLQTSLEEMETRLELQKSLKASALKSLQAYEQQLGAIEDTFPQEDALNHIGTNICLQIAKTKGV